MSITELLASYAEGTTNSRDVIEGILPNLDADSAIWISRFSNQDLLSRAEEVWKFPVADFPLRGIPFAVKDNIDVAGLPTTAGCPDFSRTPVENAPVVSLLLDAGAICIGKTNLDQFATGLVGIRSPYGIPQNPFGADFIPGGSSSGSAVAVARGLVAFSLGTDTAGSGRVPAAFNNLYGWKPTRGLLSTQGVVPACRTLDCVSVFANSPEDIHILSRIISIYDVRDPFARGRKLLPVRTLHRVGIPRQDQLEFFGDQGYSSCWRSAVAELGQRGLEVVEVDFSPFLEAARLLYDGPWVSERYLATKDFFDNHPEALHPVTRAIIEKGRAGSAADCFAAQYRLADLKRATEKVWDSVDVLCSPTAGTIYKISEVEADPIRLNSNLGYYTNFLNLLDLCGFAVPAGFRNDGLPFGVTFMARAFEDRALFALAGSSPDFSGTLELAVCGAHMSGLPLNHQLTERGAQFVKTARTAAVYRMFALDEKRPGLVRVGDGGAALDLEIWRIRESEVGSFLAGIPSPLGLGRLELEEGCNVCGFLCEQFATVGKTDITSHGGWRAWLNARNF